MLYKLHKQNRTRLWEDLLWCYIQEIQLLSHAAAAASLTHPHFSTNAALLILSTAAPITAPLQHTRFTDNQNPFSKTIKGTFEKVLR